MPKVGVGAVFGLARTTCHALTLTEFSLPAGTLYFYKRFLLLRNRDCVFQLATSGILRLPINNGIASQMEKICHADFIYGFVALLCFGAQTGPEAFERTAIRQELE